MQRLLKGVNVASVGIVSLFIGRGGFAQEDSQGLARVGKPVDGGYNFQPAATDLTREIYWFDNFLLIIISLISLFIMALLFWVVVRYNKNRNPIPAQFTHNTSIEIAWTIIPVLILIAMLPPSLKLLYQQQEIPKADVIIKATGNQWYWTYQYVDYQFEFDSLVLQRDELSQYGYMDNEYLLATDTALVLPVNKTIVVQVTSSDVIHAWAVPSFGVKQDAVPGRLAELWFKADREGIYFGQCSELCGKDHAYMPITVKIVSQERYQEWLQNAIKEYAGTPLAWQVAVH